MSSSNRGSSSADVGPSEMNDNEQSIHQLDSASRVTMADNERPFTSGEGNSTTKMDDGQRNKFHRPRKRELDTDRKSDKRAKRSRLTQADPLRVERNSDVTTDMDFTESGSGEDRPLERNTEGDVQTTFFAGNETYQAKLIKGNTLHGDVYQWKHMMLIVHRAREKGYSFRFATEMKAAGKFDDVVLEYQDPKTPERGKVHRFLQFKHVQDHKMVKVNDLLTTAKRGPFCMVNYFDSWREIRNNRIFNASRKKEFILCTNIGLDVVQLKAKRIEVKELAMDDLLRVTVRPKQTPVFFKFVDGPSVLRDELKSRAKASEEEIKEFLEQFILAVNQPNEKELSTMIKHELGASSQFNLLDVDFIGDSFQNIMVTLLKKTGRHSKFLSERDAAAFFEDLHHRLSSLITIGLKLSYSEELKNYGIKFERENSELREFLDTSNASRNSTLRLTSSNPTLLTALRVYQTVEQLESYKKMDSSIFINLEKLLLKDIRNQVLCAFKSSISHDLLVIDYGLISTSEEEQKLQNDLRHILEKNPCKKLILIIQTNNRSAIREIRHKRDDDISIIDLAKCSRKKLLEKSVIKFQGHDKTTSLGEIFSIHDFDNIKSKKLSALNEILKPETLIQLIRNNEILIGGELQGLGEIGKYYVPRTIITHVVIKAEILKDSKIPDLFAISGIKREDLEKLVATENGNQSLDETSLQKLDPEKYRILQGGRKANHFRDICEQNPKRNIHWLQVQGESGKLLWQKSTGSITNLLAFKETNIDNDNDRRLGAFCLTENELADHDKERRIVILSDTAGMGKSTVLTRLAEIMKQNQPGLLIINVNLTQHTGVLCKEEEKRTFGRDDTNGAVNFLVDKLSDLRSDFDRKIFEKIIQVTGETVLLIDGYDEICPDYGKIVIDLLRSLAKLPIKRLFVTTRPHTSDVLERELGTFSYVLQPFDRKNQMKFLTEFWGRAINSNDFEKTSRYNLEEHASAVLDILVKLINSEMLEFTGIPLQLRLVAEGFPFEEKEKLERFKSGEEPIYITDLYECFVEKKFDIFFEEKFVGNRTNLGQKKYRTDMYRAYLTKHQKFALGALFDAETVTALIKCQQKPDIISSTSQDEKDEDEGEERSGIVTQVISGKPHFVHRTFAEYFAAAFLSKMLEDNGCNSQVQKFFIAELLIKPWYRAIRAFLNCLLCRRDHAPEKDSWAFNLKENCDTLGRTLYHVAAEEHNAGIVKFFSIRLGITRENRTPNNVMEKCDINLLDRFCDTALMIAVRERVLELVECFVEGGADVNCGSSFTPMDLAVLFGGQLDLIKYLVENGAEINRESKNGLTPLHSALDGRVELNIVQYLVENGAEINRQSKNGLTPLHSALDGRVELNIVQYLVENGAEINRKSEDGSTALHCALRGRAELDVIKFLVENGAEINRESKNGLTPLHSALYGRVELNIVQYLVENSAEINRKSKDGSTALHCALRGRAELDVIKFLVENGAEINREWGDGLTPLHLAIKYHVESNVVEYLVQNGAEINRKSKDGYTALFYALRSGAELNLVEYLVESGAEINCEWKDGLTLLHCALRDGVVFELVEYLVKNGAKINHQSNDGLTAMHWELDKRARLNVLRCLVKYGAEINHETKNGLTPLHHALRRPVKLNVVKYLVENGAQINRESKDGLTALDWAIWEKVELDIVYCLVEHGAGINRVSKDGYTALLHALRSNAALHVVKYLVKNGAEINHKSKNGHTALLYALRNDAALDIVKYLVENGAEINGESEDGCTALLYALRSGAKLDVLKYLVKNGAKIDRELKDGLTALHWAIQEKVELDVVKCLVEHGAGINRVSKDGYTALLHALRSNAELDIIKYLVENGAEINREWGDGLTPLHLAIKYHVKSNVVEYLVENGAEINGESEDGCTALLYALRSGAKLDVLKYLVKNGAKIDRELKDGLTALHWAIQEKVELDVVKCLVEHGAGINRVSKDGYTALPHALRSNAELDIVKYLVKNGAEIRSEGSKRLDLADYSCIRPEVVQFLLENVVKFDCDSVDRSGRN